MSRDSSDAVEDTGRMDSEQQMRKANAPRWLEEVVKQAEEDHGEVVATIEARKEAMHEIHDNFLPSLQAAMSGETGAKAIDRDRQAQDLLSNATTLLEIYHHADSKIAATFDQDSIPFTRKNHNADVQNVKDVLLVGKRIFAGELEGVEQQARAKEMIRGKEVFEQAAATFGGGPKNDWGKAVDRTLAYVERGVRRMVKGME